MAQATRALYRPTCQTPLGRRSRRPEPRRTTRCPRFNAATFAGCRPAWQLRYYDEHGARHTGGAFATRSAAFAHYRDVIEPRLRGGSVAPPELTLAVLVDLYLERHAATRRARTIATLRERLRHATGAYGSVPLRELERMSGELADWQARLPERSRYGIVQALRQTLEAAVRWGYMSRNPARLAGPNPQPAPRAVRAFTLAEVDAIAAELSPAYRPLPAFAAATGLRPEEWAALERRDVDRPAGVLTVRRTVSDGIVAELGKTSSSRRQVPLSRRAPVALDESRRGWTRRSCSRRPPAGS